MTILPTTTQDWPVHGKRAFAMTGGGPADSNKPCVVMIHGAAHNRSIWTSLGQSLINGGFAVLAPDLPGHGLSEGHALPDIAGCADWLLALLQTAHVRRVALVGHSMGALVALEAAARAGRAVQVEALVLLGAAYPMTVAPAMLAMASSDPMAAIDKVASYSHAREAQAARAADLALMQSEQTQHQTACQGNLLHHDLALCDAYANGLAAAAAVACPSTLIIGGLDRMTPAAAASELAVALKAHQVVLATGHNLMAEDAIGVQSAVSQACAPMLR